MRLQPNWPIELVTAAAACLLLLVVLAFEWSFAEVEVPDGPWTPARTAETKLLPLPATAGGQASPEGETVNRPLFITTRRPPPAAPATPAPRIVRDQFQLQGTIVVGGLDIAMLREKQTGKVIRVEKGATVSDMTLAEVHPDRVVLMAGEETETLTLVVATGPSAPATPPGSGPAASAGVRQAGVPQPAPAAPPSGGGDSFGPRPPSRSSPPSTPLPAGAPGVPAVPGAQGSVDTGAEVARRRARQGAATW